MDRPKIMDLQQGVETILGSYVMTTRHTEGQPIFPPGRLAPIEQLAIELYAAEDRLHARMDEILAELRMPWYAKWGRWFARRYRDVRFWSWCGYQWSKVHIAAGIENLRERIERMRRR